MSKPKRNFLAAHYDWVALLVAVAAFAVAAVWFVSSFTTDPEERSASAVRRIRTDEQSADGVKPVSLEEFNRALTILKRPPVMAGLPEKGAHSFAGECRIICPTCKSARPIESAEICPGCGKTLEKEVEVVSDGDADGMVDAWERQFGLNPHDPSDANADSDGDEFTNLEEFKAGTDPSDRKSHPDYLASLRLVLPLEETFMPFYFTSAMKVPAGWKVQFKDPKKRNDYGTRGQTYSVLEGEEVGETGFVLKEYVKQEKRVRIEGGGGAEKTVDNSYVVVERTQDKKTVRLFADQKRVTVDTLATLVYNRMGEKRFTVKVGDTIKLSGAEYVVKFIKTTGRRVQIALEAVASGAVQVIEALES